MLKVVEFNKGNSSIHDLISLWWQERFSKDLSGLVRSEYGFMAYDDERPIACVFFYPTIGSSMAMIGFPLANPLVFAEKRREALTALVVAVEEKAKYLKYDLLVSYAGNKGAQELWNRENYKIADKEVVQFYKRLK